MTEVQPQMDSPLLLAASLYREGRKHALMDQTVDSIRCLLEALNLLDPMQGDNHRMMRAEVLNQLGMVEIWRGRYGTAHDSLDEATKLNPANSVYWAYLAHACMNLSAKTKALKSALKAVELDQNSSFAWHTLGSVYMDCGDKEKALDCYAEVGKHTPENPNDYYMVGNYFYLAGDKETAEGWYKKALALDPEHADANYGYSVCLTEKLKFKEAMPYITKGINSQISGHSAQWSKALAHLVLGEYEQGWKDHEIRFVFMDQEYGKDLANLRFDKPEFSLKDPDLYNKTVHVYSEQGFGDAIQFSRFIHTLCGKVKKVIFEVDKSMLTLMQYNFPQATVIAMSRDYPGCSDVPECDHRIPLGSMPYYLGISSEKIPFSGFYLDAEPEYKEKWKHLAQGPDRKIGICWAGGKRVNDKNLVKMDEHRSVDFETVKPLLDVPNTKFYGLQIGLAGDGAGIENLGPRINGWSDTAGIIANLDMVISVDTSTLHMAAAMGKPSWLINKYATCWRWMLGRVDSPWYEAVRIFRQQDLNQWQPVIAEIKEALSG